MSPLSIILVLLISFIYGVIFLIFSLFNYKLFGKFSLIFQFLITILFSFDLGIIYLLVIYKINYGRFHIYYLIPTILGFYIAYKLKNKTVNLCKILKNKLKKDWHICKIKLYIK